MGLSAFLSTQVIDTTTVGRSVMTAADAAAARTALELGTLATQSGTFSGTSSGTNTGDQSVFGTIAVSGQSNVVADQSGDTLTLAAGSNITITTDASTDTITIAASGGSPGGSSGQVQYNNAGAFGGAAALVYATSSANLTVTATGSTVKPLVAKAAASQSVSIFEAQDSSGTAFLTVSAVGVLTLSCAATNNPAIKINDPDVTVPSYSSVGFNPSLDGSTICMASSYSGTTGGINFNGFSSATNSGNPVRFTGHHGGTSPTTAAVTFVGYKHNGSTNRTALTGTELVAEFYTGSTVCLGVQANGLLKQPTTVTAGGTTGNQTIDKPTGTVNIAAAGTSVTVTNSLVSANSIVLCVIRTNDSTAQIKNVVPSSGSFVINIEAATAEVSIGFVVIN